MLIMATAAMVCDDLSINRINPFTWSGTYGLYSDGFPSTITNDGSYITEMSDEPTIYTDPLQGSDDQNQSLSGSMYLKTAQASPAPYRMFPARKNEFPDGSVTWMRPGQPWSWTGGQVAEGDTWTARAPQNFIMWLAIIALVLYIASRIKK